MTTRTKRTFLLFEILLILGLLFYFRGHLLALFNPENGRLVDHPAPELAVSSWINSQPLRLENLRGRVVLLDFWTYTCAPCRKTIPALNEWHRTYPDLVIIGIHSPETEEESVLANVKREVSALGITYPVAADNDFLSWNAFRAQLWPTMYLIDTAGMIRDIHRGSIGLREVEKMVRELLLESKPPDNSLLPR